MSNAEFVANAIKSPTELNLLIEDAIDWAHCNGLVLRTKEHKDRSDICQIAPFTLLPSPFPKRLFNQAFSVQKAMNLLYFKISWCPEFLVEAHRDVIKSDEFTRKMMEIYEQINREGIKQKITLLTQRADYMCHVDEKGYHLKQIEVNNIAVSMGGLAERATLLHRRNLQKLGKPHSSEIVPDNQPINTLALSIYKAWSAFGDPSAITLAVVGDLNQNQFDQRYIEYELERLSGDQMKIKRLTLTECFERLQLDAHSHLKLDGSVVAVVYFRAGYSPDDYHGEKEWEARLRIEKSTAIKCPWIGLQLANTKKVQQVLTRPGCVEKFFPSLDDKPTVDAIRATFAFMWGLEHDDAETKAIVKDAISNPNKYVLKPQLEGGGGNYFGQEIADKLKTFAPEKRASHILMQKISPLVIKNYLIRAFQPTKLENVVSELGIYGSLIGNGSDLISVVHNEAGGHILRTKPEHVNEGGVAVGAAVIDTPFLFE